MATDDITEDTDTDDEKSKMDAADAVSVEDLQRMLDTPKQEDAEESQPFADLLTSDNLDDATQPNQPDPLLDKANQDIAASKQEQLLEDSDGADSKDMDAAQSNAMQIDPATGKPRELPATAVTPDLTGYHSQNDKFTTAYNAAGEVHAGIVSQILAGGYSPNVKNQMLQKANADYLQAKSLVDQQKGVLDQSVYSKLKPDEQQQADALQKNQGLDIGSASTLVATNSDLTNKTSALLNSVVNNPEAYKAMDTKLFGVPQQDPNTGKVTRVGGLVTRNSLGTLQTHDTDSLDMMYKKLTDDSGSGSGNTVGKATVALSGLSANVKEQLKDIDAEISKSPTGQDLQDLQDKRAALAKTRDSLAGSLAQVAMGMQPTNVPTSSDAFLPQVIQERKLKDAAGVVSSVQAATAGQTPTQAVQTKNSLLPASAAKAGIPIVDYSNPDEALKTPAGVVISKDANGNLTPVNHDPVKWAQTVVSNINPTSVTSQLNALQSQIPRLKDQVLEKYPDLEQNSDGTFQTPTVSKAGPEGELGPTSSDVPIDDKLVNTFNTAQQNWNKRNTALSTLLKAKSFLNSHK